MDTHRLHISRHCWFSFLLCSLLALASRIGADQIEISSDLIPVVGFSVSVDPSLADNRALIELAHDIARGLNKNNPKAVVTKTGIGCELRIQKCVVLPDQPVAGYVFTQQRLVGSLLMVKSIDGVKAFLRDIATIPKVKTDLFLTNLTAAGKTDSGSKTTKDEGVRGR